MENLLNNISDPFFEQNPVNAELEEIKEIANEELDSTDYELIDNILLDMQSSCDELSKKIDSK